MKSHRGRSAIRSWCDVRVWNGCRQGQQSPEFESRASACLDARAQYRQGWTWMLLAARSRASSRARRLLGLCPGRRHGHLVRGCAWACCLHAAHERAPPCRTGLRPDRHRWNPPRPMPGRQDPQRFLNPSAGPQPGCCQPGDGGGQDRGCEVHQPSLPMLPGSLALIGQVRQTVQRCDQLLQGRTELGT